MPIDVVVDFLSSVAEHISDGYAEVADAVSDAADVIDTASLSDFTSDASNFDPIPQDLKFGASGHEWVEGAHSGYLYERIDGVYTGNYVKA